MLFLEKQECGRTSDILLRVVKQQIIYQGWRRYTTQYRGLLILNLVYPKYKRVLLVSGDKGTLVGGSDKPSKQIDPKAWVVRFCDFDLALQSEQVLPVFKYPNGMITFG